MYNLKCGQNASEMLKIMSTGQLEASLGKGKAELIQAIDTIDLETMIALPRDPNGPWQAPPGVLLLQAIAHSQHHLVKTHPECVKWAPPRR